MLCAKCTQVVEAGHGAVIILNFTNHTCGLTASKFGEVYCSFGVTSSFEYATFASS